jgi:ELWxxDGT repeat protein
VKNRTILKRSAISAIILVSMIIGGFTGASPVAANVPTDAVVMVKDINPGGNSSPDYLTAMGDTLFFKAYDPTYGWELWRSDGAEAGTEMVKDISPGIAGSSPEYLTVMGETLFFAAYNDTDGKELWKSDGTEAGTVVVKDICPGYGSSWPSHLTVMGNELFFTANDGTAGYELWKTDGTEVGTVMVKDINPSGGPGGGSSPDSMTVMGETLLFTADDGTNGYELWESDGTEAGTAMVKNINPTGDSYPYEMAVMNRTLFFQALDGTNGVELWKSDGTEAGTVMVKDINPGGGYSWPYYLTVIGSEFFFVADNGTAGNELWKSDGTEAGTVMVKDIYSGGGSSSPDSLTVMGSTLFFTAYDPDHYWELWKSDGTEAGTVMVKDINPIGDSYPYYMAVMSGTLFFSADDGTHGSELWKSDGTGAGTVMVRDINPGSGYGDPYSLTLIGGTLFFGANDGTNGYELWKLEALATDSIVNGSFETGDYTGWILLEDSGYADSGTWGIAQDGDVVNNVTPTYDFCDGVWVQQSSPGLPITYNATDGSYLAYQLQNNPENHRMYQDITLSPSATNLTWDMWYTSWEYFDPDYQYLAVNLRDPLDDTIIETLFKTTDGIDPSSIPMTSFSRDISAYAGTTVRLDIEMMVQGFYFDAAFDNFAIEGAITGGKLFMVDGSNSTIYELDPSTGVVLNIIPTPTTTDGGGDGLAYGNGRMFFTTIGTNIIYEIDPSDGHTINQLGLLPKVAVYGAEYADWNPDVQAKLNSTGLFSQVDAFLVGSGDPVPTLAELEEYDAVLVYSDWEFGNSTAMGDVLVDYIDAGGGVVMATFAFWDPTQWDGGIGGRISTDGYLPFTQNQQDDATNLTLVADDPEHPILSGVTSFNGGSNSYFNTVNLTAGAYLVAHWSNGVPLIAVKEPMTEGAGCVVGLNFWPVSSDMRSDLWDSSTDGDLLMANSLLFASSAGEPSGIEIDALGFSGDALYALEYGENATIHVLDPDTGANITTLQPGIALVGGLTFAGTRDSLFVSNSGGEQLPSFGMTDQGFEDGDFAGWAVYTGSNGTASVETTWGSPNATNYSANSGDYFAVLRNGDWNVDTYISQNFTVDAGEIVEGWAFFSTNEDYADEPYIDECSVDIMDGSTLVDRVFFADTYDANWPDTPWTYWSWEANSTGTYTLVARVVNIGDSIGPSYMGLDIPESEPTTVYEINATTGAVLNSFPGPVGSGDDLYGLGFSSSRNTLFLGFYESNMIYEVDPDDGTVINSFAGPEGAAVSALAADECGVGPAPEANFHASETTTCANVTIDFFDDSTGTYDKRYWDFGDGSNSTCPDPSHTYVTAGNYTVSLTVSDGYGDDTETKVDYMMVLPPPEAGFHANIIMACAGVTFDFTDDSTGTYDSRYWDFGDGSNSTDQNPSHAYASAGNYTVSLTISNGCGSDTETKNDYIEVLPSPEADFHASNTTICAGVAVNFTDDSTGVLDAWSWDFGDASYSTDQSPSHTYASAGNYTVSLGVENDWCDDVETKIDYITVLPQPEAGFHANIIMACAGVTFDFTDDSTGGYDNWFWDFGDGSNSTVQNPSHAYASAGNYSVSLTVSNCCCEDIETKVDYITVLPQPQANFHANITSVCANVAINFTDDSTGVLDTWYWDFGDGSHSSDQNPSHAYTSAGNYTVTLDVENSWCDDVETKIDYITVLPLPSADFHASDTSPSANVTINFIDDSTGTYDNWFWDFGDGSNSTAQNPSHNYTSVGNYSVSLTISNGCGDDTETKVNYIQVISGYSVDIDIKPGVFPNVINLRSKGKLVPVAVLTTTGFNASTVDPSTVEFAGAAPVKWVMVDVPEFLDSRTRKYIGDGDTDLLLYFKTEELQLTTASTQATLTGETFGGVPIAGTDSVRIVRG